MNALRSVFAWWRVLAWDVTDAVKSFRRRRELRRAVLAHALLRSGAMAKAVRR